MKFNWKPTAAAGAVMMLVAACGGGGGASAPAPAPSAPSVSLSGTAATGLALADGKVTVRCAKGEGTSTTDANGKYSLVITDAALPCMIQVSGTSGSTTVTLHSVAQAGTANGSDTAAVANVTPLTEMVVAQLNGALPSEIFTTFGASSKVTTEQLNAATSAVITALKDATGIDLGSIDLFKSSLVAATSSAPNAGNAYDKLLDTFGSKVPPQALDQVVNQIASAAGTASGNGPVTLKDVMTAVEGGSLSGCPTAMSGKYRRLSLWGRTNVWQLDFKALTMTSADGATQLAITPDATQACQFTATNGTTAKFQVAMGPSGVAGVRDENLTTPNTGMPGYLFPVQAQSIASLAGEWTFLQSGWMPGDGWIHGGGRITIAADRTATVCDFNSSFQCTPDSITRTLADRTDGGFDWIEAGQPNDNFYAYRAPNGTTVVFGTTNPSGSRDATVEQTSIVAYKPSRLALPEVGTVGKYWDVTYARSGANNILDPLALDSTTVLSVDAATQSVVRQRASDGRQDTLKLNQPLDGMRTRPAGSSATTAGGTVTFRGAYMLPIQGLGINVAFNSAPPPDPLNPVGYFYSISVNRP